MDVDALLTMQALERLPQKVRDELMTKAVWSGQFPTMQDVVRAQADLQGAMHKTKGGKTMTQLAASGLPMCKPDADGKIAKTVENDQGVVTQVCDGDPINFQEKAPNAYAAVLEVVKDEFIHWNVWMLNELVLNWKANKTATLHALLMKLAYLSTVQTSTSQAQPFYYPINSIEFIMFLMRFYEPVELQLTLSEALFPQLRTQKEQQRKYRAGAVRSAIQNEIEIAALVASTVPTDCKPDPARLGGKEPPYNPNSCLASVRLGGDMRLWFAKPAVSDGGKILKGGAHWELLTPKMSEPSLIQVLQGSKYQTTAERKAGDRVTFKNNLTAVVKSWNKSIQAAVNEFAETGNPKHLEKVNRLSEINPMDTTIAITKRMSALDQKDRDRLEQKAIDKRKKAILEQMARGATDGRGAFPSIYKNLRSDKWGREGATGLPGPLWDGMERVGKTMKSQSKGSKAPRVPKQKLSAVPGKMTTKRIEQLQEQALKEMLMPGGLGSAAGVAGDVATQFNM